MILSLSVGFAAGFIFVGLLPDGAGEETANQIQEFCRQNAQEGSSMTDVFIKAAASNIRLLLLIVVAGCFFYMRVLTMISLGIKGFSMGFTTGFTTLYFGAKGFLLTFVSILPQILTLIPILICMSVCAVNISLYSRKNNGNLREIRKKWLIRCCGFFAVILCCSLIDGFIVPVFVHVVSKLF
jgi:stage II sporulation protein M